MQKHRRGLVILILISGFFGLPELHAQKTYFIFMQTDTKIPFTVQMGDKTFYSNTTGYLLIPSLPAADYSMTVNFTKQQFASQTFLVEITEKDRGFRLKQDTENTWVLSDMVSQAVIRNAVGKQVTLISYDNKVNKPAIDTISKNAKGERMKVTNPNLGNGTSVTYKPAPVPVVTAFNVTKTYEKVGVNGINQVYAVLNGSKKDTISIFIPALDEQKDLPSPVKKRMKEESSKETNEDVLLNIPMPQTNAIPKKAKSTN